MFRWLVRLHFLLLVSVTLGQDGEFVPAQIAKRVLFSSAQSRVDYFDYETIQLTPEALSSASGSNPNVVTSYDFASTQTGLNANSSTPKCKFMPGDAEWPSQSQWQDFNVSLGGALVQGVPSAAVCYQDWPQYDEAKCAEVTELWSDPEWQANDPTGLNFPLFEGVTCVPPAFARPNATCTMGGKPAYIVNVTNAVNFARNQNLRLNIKNTGHDFIGKSTGAGALSIWTHFLRDIQYLGNGFVDVAGRSGSAFKVGAGVTVGELYQAANDTGLQVTGGIARTVGVAGGYIAGGGNGPLISKYGMAADQVVSLEVVLPSGQFVSVDEENHPDLFFALRGGGGSTWGIMTSVVIRAYPKTHITKSTWSFGAGIPLDTFWAGAEALFDQFPKWPKTGVYSYWSFSCSNDTGCVFSMAPQLAPDMDADEVLSLSQPLFDRLEELDISVDNLTIVEFNDYLSAFDDSWPESTNTAGIWAFHTGSRLFPESNWEDPETVAAQMAIFRHTAENSGSFFGYNVQPASNPLVNQTNAVDPAWRNTCLFLMSAAFWSQNTTAPEIAAANQELVERLQPWREIAPNGGAYLNEADANEPNWQRTFWGDNYDFLYGLKQKYDPTGVLYAHSAVGSENWYITDQLDYYPTQNGRLCRVS
ncbi:hypothetical protein E8E14_006015 [Neopestalotiopsis sp. 37M]|nr:hypothetical protein E8E14_006015 [Neopestalotiopsis sp. 37M]